MSHQQIVFAAFGTSTAAVKTYNHFESLARERYPDEKIAWAFTSSMLRKKQKQEGVHWESPAEVLARLSCEGCRRAVVQSLHVVPGAEFDKAAAAAQQAPLTASVGRPLLDSLHDCERAVSCLDDLIADPREQITVFAAHGTDHEDGGRMYREFERHLSKRYPEHVYVSMVEGEPSWDDTIEKIHASPLKSVRFIPLMFVAGDHIINDVMGERDDSWKRSLPGYEISALHKGLGYHPGIADIYFDHLRSATESLNREDV